MKSLPCWCALALLLGLPARALPGEVNPEPPRVLIVVAHPDDEIAMAVTTYKVTQELGGSVDQAVITQGEGGFHYATLAERIYGLALTEEAIGRRHLPAIRKDELIRAGRIMGIRRHHFLEQKDGSFSEDVTIPLDREWDTRAVRDRLQEILEREGYDFVFTTLPIEATHGHHKAAAVLALEAAARIPAVKRPVVLGAALEHKNHPNPWTYSALAGHPATRLQAGVPTFAVDRTVSFGHRNALNYQVLANWVIAEHKSQGILQRLPERNYELETFRLFLSEVPRANERTIALFQALAARLPGAHPPGQPPRTPRSGRLRRASHAGRLR